MKNLTIIAAIFFWGFIQLSAQDMTLQDGKFMKDGKVYTGSFSEYGDDGQLLVLHESIVNGLENGLVTYYHADGQKKEQRSYKKGEKHGIWISYFENGQKSGTANYSNGIKDGVWYVWDENGQLRYEMFYKNGEKDSTWKIWNETGELLSSKDF